MHLTQIRLIVTDFTGCVEFYRDVLGLTPQTDDPRPPYAAFKPELGSTLALHDRANLVATLGDTLRAPTADPAGRGTDGTSATGAGVGSTGGDARAAGADVGATDGGAVATDTVGGPTETVAGANGAGATPTASPDTAMVSLRVDDLNEYLAGIRDRGAEILSGPVEYDGRIRCAYLRDPEGNLIELQQWLATRSGDPVPPAS